MAAIQGKTTVPEPCAMQIVWSTVAEGDTFTASQCGIRHLPKNVAVNGTFGGATVLIQGSYDGTNFVVLNGVSGSPLAFTSAGADVLVENPPYVKPTHSGGSSESVTVTVTGTNY